MKPQDIILAERGQIVIPKEARDALGLKPGCKLQISLDGNRLVVEKRWLWTLAAGSARPWTMG